jgi:hypothetical protein
MKRSWISCVMAVMLASIAVVRGEETKTADGVLTPESTNEILVNLGYEPKLNANKKSTFQIDREGTVLYHLISTVPESLMFRVTVAEVPADLEMAAPALQAFLKANQRIAPAYFQYDAKNRHVQLVKYLPNSGWTPAKLRREIESFDEVGRSTKSLWDGDPFRRIQANSSPATVAEFGRLEGTYEFAEGTILDGVTWTAEQRAMVKLQITAAGELRFEGKSEFVRLVIDPQNTPGAVDLVIGNGAPQLSRYRVEGDVLTIHAAVPAADRPKVGSPPAGKDSLLICRRTN